MKDYLCIDAWSGRAFKSTEDKIILAIAEINSMIRANGEASANEFYDILGLAPVLAGEAYGWTEPFGLRPDGILIEGGRPVFRLGYSIAPSALGPSR